MIWSSFDETMRPIMPNAKPSTAPNSASPFLGLELKTDQSDEKPNDISDRDNGLKPTQRASLEKSGSDPFLGTTRCSRKSVKRFSQN